MIAGNLTLIAALIGLTLQAQAGQTDQQVDLPSCTLHTRTIQGPADASGPRFLMMSGVPLSGAVFKPLGERLSTRLAANQQLIVFPHGKHYLMLDHVEELAYAVALWHAGLP